MLTKLRHQAEARLKGTTRLRKCLPPHRLLSRELEVRRVELELQNEELQRTQLELAAMSARYRELFDDAPVAYLTLDARGRVVDANLAAAALVGVDRGVLYGKPLSGFMRTTEADAFHVFRHEVMRAREKRACDLLLHRADRSARAIRIVMSPSSGGGDAYRCALLDLSELRDAVDARRAAESNAQAVLDAAPDAIVTTDAERRIVSFNPAAQQAFGFPPDEIVGQPLDRLMAAPGSDGKATGLRADGSTFPLETKVACWRARGQPMLTAILRDVSEREDALARLRETQERFDLITQHVDDAIYIADATGIVQYVSPAYARIWGRPADELRGQVGGWASSVVPEDRPGLESALRALRRGDPFDLEYRIARPDGAVRWLHDRAFPIEDASGRIVRVVGVAHDRTNELEIELELRQLHKMEAIGSLSSGIAHDFNNLLQVIIGAVDVAADETTPPEQARQFLQRAKEVAVRGADLVHRITRFVRREHVQRRPLALDEALRETGPLLSPLLGEHIELVMQLAAPDVRVRMTQVQLEQILLNLASNSRDAMPSGGTLLLRSERGADDAHVRVVVRDSGAGMDPETRSRVFQPFYTTKSAGRGTGLGLASVLSVVEQIGGNIEVESARGAGTTVSIDLPTCPADPAPEDRRARNARLEGGVLLVEDEPVVRTALRRQLEAVGLDVIEADNGAHALALAETRRPTLVVSDVLMPEMTGPELVRALRERWPDLPVLYLSGDPGDALDATALDARARLLAKPFDERELVAEVVALVDGRGARETATAGRRLTVLVVEDEEISRWGMEKLLTQSGFIVAEAGSLAEAREVASTRAIDVLLTDIRLPDGRGDALAREIRALLPHVSVIYMSGAPPSGPNVREPYLEKPIDIDQLLAVIAQEQSALGGGDPSLPGARPR